MTISDLITEAQRIAKPSLLLSEAPSPTGIVGWWGGSRPAGHRGRPDDLHRLSIDCGWLAAHGSPLHGVVSVYDVAAQWGWPVPVHVEHTAPASLAGVPGATALYGREVTSLPPLEALCLYGSAAMEQWLASAGLDRSDYDRATVLAPAREYQNHYQQHSPLYSRDAAAVLGGWHAMWPDDDFYIPKEMRLIVWTLKDSEPWVEVFARGANLTARVRGT